MTACILVIEDNAANVELMTYLLGAFGYQVVSASDGEAGLNLALHIAADLIICDIEMPNLNGFEVLRALRGQHGARQIPILAVTAYAMAGDREKVLGAGFDGYVSKPIDPETFVNEVEAFLPAEKCSAQRPLAHNLVSPAADASAHPAALILVVDDSPVNLALIKSTLEPSGYRVVTAESAQAALRLTSHYAFDLILSDLHMSPESGLDFLTRIKSLPAVRSIPFILCTSSRTDSADGIEQRATSLGVDKFLSRPIAPGRLLEEIAACLKGRRESVESPTARAEP